MDTLLAFPAWMKPELVVKGLIALAIGLALAKMIASLAERGARRHADKHSGMLVGKLVYYGIVVLVWVLVLDIFNVRLTAILAAAGIMSVALGFAAQASVSNIVSGLFLLIDRPFEIDDVIEIDGITGTVSSIDLLSTKLRTLDNLYVRIPNESLVRNKLVNYTRFKTRRLNITVHLGHEHDISLARQAILDEARQYAHALQEPHPFVMVSGFGQNGAKLDLYLWVKGEAYLQSMSDLNEKIRNALAEKGIHPAYPHLSVETAHQIKT